MTSRALGSRYELVSQLGSGAMGEVWRAVDHETGEHVAAKVLRSELSQNTEIVGRFIQERAIIRSLTHPNIVRVHDLVVEGERLAIVMDLIEGEDLRQVLRAAGTLPPALAVEVLVSVLHGLAAAHAQGVLHRDVKPDNVMLSGDWREDAAGSAVRLTDFSIARLAQDSTVQATGLLGTPEYMPPELFTNGTTSAASDVYAAGVVLYELLAGRSPFAGPGTAYTIGNRAVTMLPPQLPVPPSLWSVLVGMLDKDPRRRPRATDAAASLESVAGSLSGLDALPVQAAPVTWQPVGGDAPELGVVRPRSEDAALDVGRTNLDVAFAPEEARAGAGEVAALTPEQAPALEAGVTNVVAAAPAYTAPTLEPAVAPVAADEPRSRLQKVLIGVGVGVLVTAVVAGIWVLLSHRSGGGGDEAAAGAGAVQASVEDDTVPGTGLTVDRKATYDAEKKSVTMTLDISAGRVALAGPLLEVVPRSKGESDCPLPAWEGTEAQPNDPLATGITTPCGYTLDVGTIEPGSPTEVSATVPLDLGDGDPQQGLESWLQATSDATAKALQGAGDSNTEFAAQRLQGVDIEVPGLVSVTRGELNVRIFPVWGSGGSADKVHPLFVSKVNQPTKVLTQVAGGLDGIRFAEECDGAVVINGRSVSVVRQSPGCTIRATVGNLSDVSSNEFQIAGKGS